MIPDTLDSVAKRCNGTALGFLYRPKPVDIRNPFLMSPLLSHPGFAFLMYIAVPASSKLLHRRPVIHACLLLRYSKVNETTRSIPRLCRRCVAAPMTGRYKDRGRLWRSLAVLEAAVFCRDEPPGRRRKGDMRHGSRMSTGPGNSLRLGQLHRTAW